ncbi:MAG: ABC transporter substrate-binding protein [Alphaproteobacteria bacterium]|nr:ABC transporter substrate-binding protein [Alphaproteobacteria bacterium]
MSIVAKGRRRPGHSVAALALAVLALGLIFPPASSAAPANPRRIASLNVCTDQLLLLLGLRARLVSVTFLAADPSSSALAERARGLRLNRGRAEEILTLKPDLVLAGSTAASPTVQLLRRLGYPVRVVPLAIALADIPRNIATVARAVGEAARGAEMIARFQDSLRRITAGLPAPEAPRPTALLIGPNGISSGHRSLAGAIIDAAGFANGAAGLGLAGVGRVPLELVIRTRPQLLILSNLKADHPSLAVATLAHPALAGVTAGRTTIRIQHHVWACGTPLVLDAIARLVRIRRGIDAAARGERR